MRGDIMTDVMMKNKKFVFVLFLVITVLIAVAVFLVHRYLLLPLAGAGVLADPGRLIWTHLGIVGAILGIILSVYCVFLLRYRSLERISEGNRRFRILFENSRDAIFIRTLDGFFVDVNDAMLSLFGYARDEMIGMSVDEIYVNTQDRKYIEEQIRVHGYARSVEIDLKKKNGDIIHCIANVQAWKSPDGEIKGVEGIIRDITEERCRMIFEHAPIGIFYFDNKGVIIDCNQKFVDIIGSSRQALVGFDMPARLQDKKMLEQILLTLEGKTGFYEGRYRSITAKKETPVRVITMAIISDLGEIIGAIGIVEDLTESMAYSEEGRKSEERFRAVFEGAPLGVVLTTLKGEIVDANNAFEKLTGYNAVQLRGMKVERITYPDDFSEEKEIIADLVQGLINRAQIVKRYVKKNGEIVWVRLTASILHDREGNAEYVLGLVENITERKKAREELQREKERLAVTLASIGDGVITTDTEGKVMLINRVAEELTGWKSHEAFGKQLEEIFVIINERTRMPCENPVKKVIESGKVVGLANHTVLIARDGIERRIADSGAPIQDEFGNVIGMVLVFRDVTETAKIEEELRKAQKLESIDTLAGGIAHDFNNILTSIMGSISLLKMKIDKESELFNYLMDAEHAARQARELTQQLLTFSRGGTPIKKTVQLSGLLQDICSFSTRGSNVKCEYEIAGDLWPVDVDMGQFSQVINNMLINAIQAMPQGGIIHVSAENDVLDKADIDSFPYERMSSVRYVKIRIVDQGVGIAPDVLPKIFDPYYTTKENGSGLGLAIAYSVIKRHDGIIDVQSKPGEGTSFSIYLPASSASVVDILDPGLTAFKGQGKILLMDDDENILRVTKKMLVQLGYSVELARNGDEAIAMYVQAKSDGKPFDLVIMDLTIPGGMGGRECAIKLKEIDPHVKALVSSGYSNDPVMSDFARFGFKGILMKPYRIEDLSAILKRVLSQQ